MPEILMGSSRNSCKAIIELSTILDNTPWLVNMPRGYSRPEARRCSALPPLILSIYRYLNLFSCTSLASLILTPHNSNHVIRPKSKTYQQFSHFPNSISSDCLSPSLALRAHLSTNQHIIILLVDLIKNKKRRNSTVSTVFVLVKREGILLFLLFCLMYDTQDLTCYTVFVKTMYWYFPLLIKDQRCLLLISIQWHVN